MNFEKKYLKPSINNKPDPKTLDIFPAKMKLKLYEHNIPITEKFLRKRSGKEYAKSKIREFEDRENDHFRRENHVFSDLGV